MEKTFKKDDLVTCVDPDHWINGGRGFVIQVIPMDTLDSKHEDRNILIGFKDIKIIEQLRHLSSDGYPERKSGMIYWSAKELILGHAPFTEEELTEMELAGFGLTMRPWVGMRIVPHRSDNKCQCEGCANYASEHIWINLNGFGVRYHVCKWHEEEFGACSCREDVPFKEKEEIHVAA